MITREALYSQLLAAMIYHSFHITIDIYSISRSITSSLSLNLMEIPRQDDNLTSLTSLFHIYEIHFISLSCFISYTFLTLSLTKSFSFPKVKAPKEVRFLMAAATTKGQQQFFLFLLQWINESNSLVKSTNIFKDRFSCLYFTAKPKSRTLVTTLSTKETGINLLIHYVSWMMIKFLTQSFLSSLSHYVH